ncbi:hypothetical protein TanjilG_07733 [Lupinus angustifolius]|uniref:Response regulatory domain-containing protein n=1 Tax=Lupinus angustifolius TaxID=3871 RepID=A0A1J7GV42_LUPAN|nr:hypothetical protein TanjilG_07733 [Lupinus angustifolius]
MERLLLSLVLVVLVSSIVLSVSAIDVEFGHCNCDEEGIWSIQSILVCQKVSDLFIAIAYFSIPIELLYFVSYSNVPFKLVFLQFIAFIVLCGLTHLLNAYTYYGPHSFQLLLSLTVAKFLTALVSCATAITFPTLIPLLLKVKVREFFLRQNVFELGQEVGMMKKQKETSWHVRMLTREIRKSLDKHTILYTMLVELSKSLDLHNCAVWMPDEERHVMHLTHKLKPGSGNKFLSPIPINEQEVLEIRKSKGAWILRPDSALGAASYGGGGGTEVYGNVAAIRMPILHVSNFKGGTPEFVETSYAILVLVLPNSKSRVWTSHEMEIVEVVADQVAVALSHASVLEESQLMRQKLADQNRALEQAQKNAMMASQARSSFQRVMNQGMRRPMHSILGLLSIFKEDNIKPEQKIIIDTMLKVSTALSSLINDMMEISENDKGSFRSQLDESISTRRHGGRRHNDNEPREGLSFSMCKKLVQMMQGNIWITTNSLGLPQGMTLFLKFQTGPSLGRSILTPKQFSHTQFRSFKVVLADDDGVNRTVTKKLLEKLGFQVTAVSSGFECLSAISASGNSFKIIVLDLHMPEMDSFEVVRRIRKFHSHNWPLIIALTASAEKHVKERCLEVGMQGLMRKPILLHELADELRTVLQCEGENL